METVRSIPSVGGPLGKVRRISLVFERINIAFYNGFTTVSKLGDSIPLFVREDCCESENIGKQRMDMDALPFCRATLYGVRCPQGPHYINVKGYPTEPRSIGEAIRKRRLDLNLRQVDAAKSIGCNEMTIVNWEKGHTRPRRKKYSAIRTFLGPLAKQWLVWFGA